MHTLRICLWFFLLQSVFSSNYAQKNNIDSELLQKVNSYVRNLNHYKIDSIITHLSQKSVKNVLVNDYIVYQALKRRFIPTADLFYLIYNKNGNLLSSDVIDKGARIIFPQIPKLERKTRKWLKAMRRFNNSSDSSLAIVYSNLIELFDSAYYSVSTKNRDNLVANFLERFSYTGRTALSSAYNVNRSVLDVVNRNLLELIGQVNRFNSCEVVNCIKLRDSIIQKVADLEYYYEETDLYHPKLKAKAILTNNNDEYSSLSESNNDYFGHYNIKNITARDVVLEVQKVSHGEIQEGRLYNIRFNYLNSTEVAQVSGLASTAVASLEPCYYNVTIRNEKRELVRFCDDDKIFDATKIPTRERKQSWWASLFGSSEKEWYWVFTVY